MEYEGEAQMPAPNDSDLMGFDQDMFLEITPTDDALFDEADLDISIRQTATSQKGNRFSDVVKRLDPPLHPDLYDLYITWLCIIASGT